MSSRRLALMKPEEIQRIIMDRTGEIQEAEQALKRLEDRKARAREIAMAFQYRQYEVAMDEETVAIPADVVLLKKLTEIGIQPFDRGSVMRYKDSMTRTIFNLLVKGFGWPLFFVGLVCSGIVLIAAKIAPASLGGTVLPHATWGFLLGVGCFLLWAEHAIIPRRAWDITQFSNTHLFSSRTSLVPNSVFDIAFAVRDVLSPTEFYIHQLQKDYGPWFKFIPDRFGNLRADPDPFLEVRFGGESYFIAVWDESGFDGKLMEVH